jgi:tetratricopeptide (TPR) repeat protein
MTKRLYILIGFVFGLCTLHAQPSAIHTDPDSKYKQAEWYFIHEQYTLALPLLKELEQQVQGQGGDVQALATDDIHYYLYACQLMDDENAAVEPAKEYINSVNNQARVQQLSFFLGDYYFRAKDFAKALTYLENAGISNLTNDEIAKQKFELGYCYFNQQQFDKAQPLLDAIRQMPNDPHYADANYYCGYMAYSAKQFSTALDCFQKAEKVPAYQGTAAFFETEIYYFLGQKDKALSKGATVLQQQLGSAYSIELNRLVGHMYFERKQFDKAQPYLEAYMNGSDKIRREDLYELSYCYYANGHYDKAIDGFKQLSDRTDSLSQSAMYMLGDAYLKTGDKASARNAFSFCAENSSYAGQREVSLFNYSKLSVELGYQNIALDGLKKFLQTYPNSSNVAEARELLVGLLANTSNYREALELLQNIQTPSVTTQRLYPRILYGRAVEYINDQQLAEADELLTKILSVPYNDQVLPLTYFWKGELAYRAGKYEDGIRFLDQYLRSGRAVQGDVGPREAKYDMGYCLFQLQDYNRALGYFDQVAKKAGFSTPLIEQDAYLRSADCYFMLKQYKKAKDIYDIALSNHWQSSDYALYQEAMIAGISNGSAKVKLLQQVAHNYPGSRLVSESNMEIANTLLSEEHFGDALPYLTAVANDPNAQALKPKVYLKMGIAEYNLNKTEAALSQYKQLVTEFPNAPEATEAMANIKAIYIDLGKPSDYIAYAQTTGKAVSGSEADSLTYASAQLQYDNGNCPDAVRQFADYIAKFPQGQHQIPAHFFSAECLNGQKKYTEALAGYDYVVSQGSSAYAEKAALGASRIAYFESKDYQAASNYFSKLRDFASNDQNQMEALRGLLRCQYQLQHYDSAALVARELLAHKGLSNDDKALGALVTAKNLQLQQQYDPATTAYKTVVSLNKGEWAAEARYEIAHMLLDQNNLPQAEKAGFEVINKSGSYDQWVTKAYLLLGDVYDKRKDYFNAKATFQSIAQNASIPELKALAQQRLEQVKQEEAQHSKIGDQ